jgi:hypothetical protein
MATTTTSDVRPVPATFETLEIGTVAGLTTDYNVYFKNIATDRELLYPLTSDGSGVLTISVATDGLKVIPGEWYEVRAVLDSDKDQANDVLITIGADATYLIKARFTEVYSLGVHNEFTDLKFVID